MKRFFAIFNILGIIATAVFVSVIMFFNIDSGKDIYPSFRKFSSSGTSALLQSDLSVSANLINSADMQITAVQKGYVPVLITTISKLDSINDMLSIELLFDENRNIKSTKIVTALNELNTQRDDLIFNVDLYNKKMSGNIYGNPEGSYDLFLLDVLDYIDSYSRLLKQLNNYIDNTLNNERLTRSNICDFYFDSAINVCENYEYLSFRNFSFATISSLNTDLTFEPNNNLELHYSEYSVYAHMFNVAYAKCDVKELIKQYTLIGSVDINSENDLEKIAYYYLDKVMGG